MVKGRKKTIVDFFENSSQSREQDQDLLRAIEESKKEHIKEQQRLFEQLSKQRTIPLKRKRLIQKQDLVEDDWFQTLSNRPQPKKQVQVKSETSSEEPSLVIENLTEWLNVKQEDEKAEDAFYVEDLTSFLQQQEQDPPTFHCSICNQEFSSQSLLDNHETSCRNTEIINDDGESDCSVIDLVNTDYIVPDDVTTTPPPHQEEEEDGYLSPLEGFTNINENRGEYSTYFDQLQQGTSTAKRKSRGGGSTSRSTRGRSSQNSSRGKRRPYNKKWYYRKKKK